MSIAKLFKNGNSQAVRIPRSEQIGEVGDEVTITRTGNRIIIELVKKDQDWLSHMGGSLPREFTESLKKRPDLRRSPKVN